MWLSLCLSDCVFHLIAHRGWGGGQVEVESLRSQVSDMTTQLEALRQDNAAMTQR